ncbi:hypothetical protein [Streptomyces sp. NPDC006285]|uniref:hypothetical protein n=1 Tax=Streptomyces sp. NPDC006285 TaxID=3364742 RepID=UPI00369AC438
MAQNSWPSPVHNSRAVSDTEYEKIAARFSDDGVWGVPTDTAIVAAGAGRSVDVRPDVFASVRGHAWYSGTTAVNLPISANASGSTRIDRVVLRLDRSAWTVRAVVREGTPGSPAPALVRQTGDTGVYEVLLANVTVLNGAASVSVSRAEMYIGSRVRPAHSSSKNPNPTFGELAAETDTGRLRMWNGSAWVTVYDAITDVEVKTTLAGWSSVVDPVLDRSNGVICLRLGQFSRSGNLAGPTDSRLPVLIPSAFRHPNRNAYTGVYITGARVGRITIYPDNHARAGQAWLSQKPDLTSADDVLANDVSWVRY